MAVDHSSSTMWLTGSPWGEMRLHAKTIDTAAGLRFALAPDISVEGRSPRWILTPEGHAGVLIPANVRDAAKELEGSARIRIGSFFMDGSAWFRIVCLDHDLEAVFQRFCDSIFLELSEGVKARKAVVDVLERYRQLFAVTEQEVESGRIAGLFCELATLEWLLEHGIDAVAAWVGPEKETHDFVFDNVHLEVKALPASGERKCRISNFRQLEAPQRGFLYLVGIRLRPGNATIGQIFERVCKLSGSEKSAHLEGMMRKAGCPVPVNAAWNRLGFANDPPEAWLVGETFPRLVPDLLPGRVEPDGILEVQYRISLEKAADCAVLAEEMISTLASE